MACLLLSQPLSATAAHSHDDNCYSEVGEKHEHTRDSCLKWTTYVSDSVCTLCNGVGYLGGGCGGTYVVDGRPNQAYYWGTGTGQGQTSYVRCDICKTYISYYYSEGYSNGNGFVKYRVYGENSVLNVSDQSTVWGGKPCLGACPLCAGDGWQMGATKCRPVYRTSDTTYLGILNCSKDLNAYYDTKGNVINASCNVVVKMLTTKK